MAPRLCSIPQPISILHHKNRIHIDDHPHAAPAEYPILSVDQMTQHLVQGTGLRRFQKQLPAKAFVQAGQRGLDRAQYIDPLGAAGAEVTVETKAVTLSSEPPTPIRVAFFKGPDGEIVEFFEDDVT